MIELDCRIITGAGARQIRRCCQGVMIGSRDQPLHDLGIEPEMLKVNPISKAVALDKARFTARFAFWLQCLINRIERHLKIAVALIQIKIRPKAIHDLLFVDILAAHGDEKLKEVDRLLASPRRGADLLTVAPDAKAAKRLHMQLHRMVNRIGCMGQ